MWGTAEKRYVGHVCLRNPFPLFLLGIPSIHSLPEAGFWEPQYVPPGLHYGCIMPIPSLQLQKNTSLMQRSKGFGHGFVVSKICYNALIVLSVVLCDCCKPMNTCRDRAFSNSGLEAGLPAFQLPMFVKCDALLKRKSKESIHSLQEAGSWEPQYVPPVLHHCCIMLAKVPIPLLKIPDLWLMQRSIGLVSVVVSKVC